MEIKLRMFSVVLLIGPTMSGKTYLTKNVLIPQTRKLLEEKGIKPIVGYISSDDIRRDLLANPDANKYDKEMLQISEKSFKLLHQKLESLMEWPHNSFVIFIDTTGLSENFRNKVILQAKAAQYNVAAIVFDYKDKAEYERFIPPEQIDRRLLFKHIDRLKKDVWRTMKRDVYDSVTQIKNKNFEELKINIRDIDDYSKTILNSQLKYDMVGDIHGCFTPDTKVSLLDGRNLSFLELEKEYGRNGTFWVYSCTNDEVVPGLASNVHKTRINAKIIGVRLDSGAIIKCTPDHLFMLRDGTYKRADELTSGQSLMPLYKRQKVMYEDKSYEQVFVPKISKYIYTHRLVARHAFPDYKKGLVVHHKKGKSNNSPLNLELMTSEQHWKYHSDSIADYNKSKEHRELISRLCKEGVCGWGKAWKIHKDRWSKLSSKKMIKLNKSDIQRKKVSDRMKILNRNEAFANKRDIRFVELLKKNWENPNYRKKMAEISSKTARIINSDENLLKYKRIYIYPNYYSWKRVQCCKTFKLHKKHVNIPSFGDWFKTNNHKVVEIIDLGSSDVYDLTVEKYHNFALTDGIFVHNCLSELKQLLTANGYVFNDETLRITPPEGRGLIFLGDIIDKGPNSFELLKIAYNHRNEHWFKLVWGNHENFVTKYLHGELKDVDNEDYMAHFNTTELFKENEEAKKMLLELRQIATNFVQHEDFIVTHAPCLNKFLGKLDYVSTKQMRGQYQRPKREDYPDEKNFITALEERFSFLKTEAIFNAPYHIFGHVTTGFPVRVANKVGIDTGCVTGGYLTMASLTTRGIRTYKVQSLQPQTEEFVDIFVDRERKIDIGELDSREYGRMMWAARNKVAFISGTMAPANATESSLESLDSALDYYLQHGITKLVLQPKYMGSRCNIYLSENISECFAVSRNGYLIKPDKVNLENVFKGLQQKYKNTLLVDKKLIILDGELMPWRALGAGLIDEEFKVIELGVQTELDTLRSTGFEQTIVKTQEEMLKSGFVEYVNSLMKEQVHKKFGQAKTGTFRSLLEHPVQSIDETQSVLDVYKEQVKLFGSDEQVNFKPFGILKTISKDGTERNWQADGESNLVQFAVLSEDKDCYIDLNEKVDRERALAFFKEVTEDKQMEGIVVKPDIIDSRVAPALKVRGPRYLTMVYGYDYLTPKKHTRLIKSKHTRRKVETSIKEFRLGQKMLTIPYSEISESNQTYLQLVAAMITEEKFEKSLDPRL